MKLQGALVSVAAFLAAGCASPAASGPVAPGRADAGSASALPDPLAAGWKGEKTCELLVETAQLRMLRCTFPPGVGHERHFHAPHMAYALQGGRMRLTDASGVREASPQTGSSYWSDGVAWHEALNIGDTTVQYLIIEPKPQSR